MQYYTPAQNRPTASAQPIAGRTFNPGDASKNASQQYGDRLTVNGIGDPGWGTGVTFAANSKIAALNALKNSMSSANPEDYAGMDEMRNYYRDSLAGLPQLTADKISSLGTQTQRDLSSGLNTAKNASAGTGRLGSRQYSAQQSNLASAANNDYLNKLIAARGDEITRAGQVGTGLESIQNRDLTERGFQYDQGQSLSDQILKLMGIDQNREQTLQSTEDAKDAAKSGAIASAFSNGGKAFMSAGAAASDARIKKSIDRPSNKTVLAPFKDSKPYSYEYKEAARFGSGKHISPMAQDLEAAGMGECVTEIQGVKMIDYGKALGRMFAAISVLTEKVEKLEALLGE